MEPAFAGRQACLAGNEMEAFNFLVKTMKLIISIS